MKSYKTNSMIIASIQTPVRLPTLATFYFSTCVNLVELSVPLTETNGPVRYKHVQRWAYNKTRRQNAEATALFGTFFTSKIRNIEIQSR